MKFTLLIMTLLAPMLARAADAPDLPPNWQLKPITGHPCLLFGPADAPAIKARLIREFGAVGKIGDKELAVFFAGDEKAKRRATEEFVQYWKKYSERWRKDNL